MVQKLSNAAVVMGFLRVNHFHLRALTHPIHYKQYRLCHVMIPSRVATHVIAKISELFEQLQFCFKKGEEMPKIRVSIIFSSMYLFLSVLKNFSYLGDGRFLHKCFI